VVVGWTIGGVVGLGTLLFAFLIGPSLAGSLFILNKIFGKKNKIKSFYIHVTPKTSEIYNQAA
jgi:uncharacterized membrane protein YczE